jgi:hypothetical protein
MNYTKTEWKDLPDTSTPITSSRLNNMEDGIEYLFEHGVGGGDNLPVGVEMDFDGTSQDIPTGWTQVSPTQQILWTNSDPTQSITTDTSITLSSSDYDILEMFYMQRANQNYSTYSTRFLKSSTGTRCYLPSTDGNIYRTINKNSDTSLTIGTIIGSTDSTLVIPLYVIGYKTGLFSQGGNS